VRPEECGFRAGQGTSGTPPRLPPATSICRAKSGQTECGAKGAGARLRPFIAPGCFQAMQDGAIRVVRGGRDQRDHASGRRSVHRVSGEVAATEQVQIYRPMSPVLNRAMDAVGLPYPVAPLSSISVQTAAARPRRPTEPIAAGVGWSAAMAGPGASPAPASMAAPATSLPIRDRRLPRAEDLLYLAGTAERTRRARPGFWPDRSHHVLRRST